MKNNISVHVSGISNSIYTLRKSSLLFYSPYPLTIANDNILLCVRKMLRRLASGLLTSLIITNTVLHRSIDLFKTFLLVNDGHKTQNRLSDSQSTLLQEGKGWHKPSPLAKCQFKKKKKQKGANMKNSFSKLQKQLNSKI